MSSASRATLRRLATITVVFGAAFVGRALVASAAEPDRHGYWKQDGIGALGAPAADVPAGGLLVSKGLADEAAVSAISLTVGGGTVSSIALVATDAEAEGGVLACRATSAWSEPDGAGAWTDRPDHDCETASVAGVAADGTWTFDIAGLVKGGVLDVVFVPDDSMAPFSIAFEAPTSATVRVSWPPAPPVPPATTSGPSGGVMAPPATFAPQPSSSGFDPPPSAFEPVAEPVDTDTTDSPPETTPLDGPTDLGAPAADLTDLADAAGPSGLALAVVALTALAAAAVWLQRRMRASVELSVTHPLAGPPSLAGDSVRNAGRALVDDDAAEDGAPSAPDAAMEMAR